MNKKVLIGVAVFLLTAVGVGAAYFFMMPNPQATLENALKEVKSGNVKQVDADMSMKLSVSGINFDMMFNIKGDIPAKKLYASTKMSFMGQENFVEVMCMDNKFYAKSIESDNKWEEASVDEAEDLGVDITDCDTEKQVGDASIFDNMEAKYASYEEKTVNGKSVYVYKLDAKATDDALKKLMDKTGGDSDEAEFSNVEITVTVDKSSRKLIETALTMDMTGDFGGQEMTIEDVQVKVTYNSINSSVSFPDPTK